MTDVSNELHEALTVAHEKSTTLKSKGRRAMTDLTDIQIIKRLAEIEGHVFGLVADEPRIQEAKCHGTDCGYSIRWNPLAKTTEGKALCWDLGNKFDIVKVWEEYDCLGFYYTDLDNYLNAIQYNHKKIHEVFRVEDHGEQKAVCLAIIAKEDNKGKDSE